jgi:YD repeat-containing protein
MLCDWPASAYGVPGSSAPGTRDRHAEIRVMVNSFRGWGIGIMQRYPVSPWQRPTFQGKGNVRYSDLVGLATVARTTLLYDAASNVISNQHTNGSGINDGNYTYAYDPGHNLTSETDNGTLHTYAYNSVSELTGQGTTTYGYDSSGNRTGSGQVIGTDNQFLSDSTWTYSYDGEGTLTKKTMGLSSTTWTYGYDNANHLVQAQEWSKDPSNRAPCFWRRTSSMMSTATWSRRT